MKIPPKKRIEMSLPNVARACAIATRSGLKKKNFDNFLKFNCNIDSNKISNS